MLSEITGDDKYGAADDSLWTSACCFPPLAHTTTYTRSFPSTLSDLSRYKIAALIEDNVFVRSNHKSGIVLSASAALADPQQGLAYSSTPTHITFLLNQDVIVSDADSGACTNHPI